MGDEPVLDRKEFIGRIGTFFFVMGFVALLIFISADISRTDSGRMARMTQTYIVLGVQALQTRDTGARQAIQNGQPTPTLVPAEQLAGGDYSLVFFSLFCIGALALIAGYFLRRLTAAPAKSSGRFEGVRKWRQKQKEAREKREAAKKKK